MNDCETSDWRCIVGRWESANGKVVITAESKLIFICRKRNQIISISISRDINDLQFIIYWIFATVLGNIFSVVEQQTTQTLSKKYWISNKLYDASYFPLRLQMSRYRHPKKACVNVCSSFSFCAWKCEWKSFKWTLLEIENCIIPHRRASWLYKQQHMRLLTHINEVEKKVITRNRKFDIKTIKTEMRKRIVNCQLLIQNWSRDFLRFFIENILIWNCEIKFILLLTWKVKLRYLYVAFSAIWKWSRARKGFA